jgi:hypothetical protein
MGATKTPTNSNRRYGCRKFIFLHLYCFVRFLSCTYGWYVAARKPRAPLVRTPPSSSSPPWLTQTTSASQRRRTTFASTHWPWQTPGRVPTQSNRTCLPRIRQRPSEGPRTCSTSSLPWAVVRREGGCDWTLCSKILPAERSECRDVLVLVMKSQS